jgi:hypothetical protein
MATRKPKPPSRRRYEEENPTIGVHVPREVRARLVALSHRSGLSIGKLVQQLLGVAEKDIESIREKCRKEFYAEGWRACYAELLSIYRITYACSACGEHIVVGGGSDEAEAAAAFLTRQGWGHRKHQDEVT